jgi:site-specific DNA-methyltransferase (adenine-specific)
LPTPYYQDDSCTIYHGDCREMLDDLWFGVDLLLADPPYGIRYELKPQIVGHGHRRRLMGGKPAIVGDAGPFDPSHMLHFRKAVLWGANWYADQLPPSGGWLVWDKTGGGRGPRNNFVDAEMAWTNAATQPHIFRHLWKGLTRDSEAGQAVLHATQKPVALMEWVLDNFSHPGDLILDPYMGSGPVLKAAKNLGRRAIGIEIEERYCEIAAKRLAQEVLPLEVV